MTDEKMTQNPAGDTVMFIFRSAMDVYEIHRNTGFNYH